MSAIDDLNAAVTNIGNAVTAAVADIQKLASQIVTANTANDPAIESAVSQLNTLATNLNNAVNPPAPTPAPAPAPAPPA